LLTRGRRPRQDRSHRGYEHVPRASAAGSGQSLCIGHYPQDFVWYTSSCTGHDEPEIDPLSSAPGSAQNLKWTIVLPTDEAGTTAGEVGQVDSVGPTFWIGGTVTHTGTIVLDSKIDGPLMPAFSVQKLGNALGWGLVNDAPNSLVWEIGHTGNFTTPADQYCIPGDATKPPCYSFDVPSWLRFQPLQIKGVTFASTD
jgi:hypothetical protein